MRKEKKRELERWELQCFCVGADNKLAIVDKHTNTQIEDKNTGSSKKPTKSTLYVIKTTTHYQHKN